MAMNMHTFSRCAPDNPGEWPLWWIRYALLRPRLNRIAKKYGRGSFGAGYAASPLMYNVFGELWLTAMMTRVKVVNRTVTDRGDDQLVSTEVHAVEPADAGTYKWALENGLV